MGEYNFPKSQAEETKREQGVVALEKIRPELNLEKWSIWQPAKSKNPPKAKIFQREISLPEGSKITAKVKVGFTDEGVLTTEDQKTYYALIKHWEDKGRSEKQISFSLRQLAKILKKGEWGTNVIESISKSMIRLRGTLFTWENSYFDNSTKETLELLDTFNILSELKIAKRKRDGAVNNEAGYFRFNDFILKNLLTNHTKPLLLDAVLQFKSEIAQLLYTHLDLILADKNRYERRTKELFDDLGLGGKKYVYPSGRKQELEKALQELQGVRLTTGFITSATLKRTTDKKDYKIVVRKSSLKEKSKPALPGPTETRSEERLQKHEPTKDHITLQAEELVRHFYKLFHDVDAVYPTSKEIDQAVGLISRHGLSQARYIVDFSHRATPETKYKPQTFGGIIQYTSRASADYEAEEGRREAEIMRQEEEQREREKREKEKQELDEFYQSLPREEQERVDREAMENLRADLLIGRQLRRKGEKAFDSPFVRAAFEDERQKILQRIKQEEQ